jgi:hypothetical protein
MADVINVAIHFSKQFYVKSNKHGDGTKLWRNVRHISCGGTLHYQTFCTEIKH